MKYQPTSSQKGFTLIELLAVMAIIGVLAAIVVPAVAGTRQASTDAEVREGAFTVESAASEFFAAQRSSEILSNATRSVNATINGDMATTTQIVQKISSRWAENYLTDDATSTGTFAVEFRTATTTTDSRVRAVVITDLDGNAITRSTLLTKYTAIDFGVLTGTDTGDSRSREYLNKRPSTADSLSNDEFHSYLWMFRKVTSASSNTEDGRKVSVFKLEKVDEDESGSPKPVTLTYKQVF